MNIQHSDDLKNDILTVAAGMFRSYGYDGTTFQKIADKLGITKGAITYHFKNKHLIMGQIFQEYFDLLRNYIDSFHDEYLNVYWRYCVMYIFFYRTILTDANLQDLFYHKDQMSLWESSKVSLISNIYKDIAKDFHKNFTQEELTMNALIDLGARHRLYLEYKNNPDFLTIDKYCYYHILLIGTLSRLDEATIKYNINLAFSFADKHNPPAIPLLQ